MAEEEYNVWETLGRSMSKGFDTVRGERKTEREKIQALDAAKSNLKYDPATGSYSSMDGSVEFLQQQNSMLTQQLKSLESNITTDKQWSAIVDGVQTGSYESFNSQINNNPTLNKIFKQQLGVQSVQSLNPWDNDKQLGAYAATGMNPEVLGYLKQQRDALLNGQEADMSREDYLSAIKSIGTAYPIVEDNKGNLSATSLDQFLAATNLTKNAVRTEERKLVYDTIAMGKQALTGVTDKAYQANVKSLEAKAVSDTDKARQGTQATDVMMKAIATGKPEEVMKALQLTNPEAFLKGTRGDSGRRDSLQQYMEALTLAGVPENEKPAYLQKWVQKSTEGVGAVSKETDVGQLSGDREEAKNLYTANAANDPEWSTKARNIQDRILSNADEKVKKSAYDTEEKLKGNHNTASNIERILKTAVPKIDKDLVQNTVDWVRTKVGAEAAQTFANVDFNTRAGMLIAAYVKEISGTAASDKERADRINDLLSGNYTDEVYIKQSMKTFANELRAENNTMAKGIIDVLPYSVSKYTNLAPKQSKTVKTLPVLPRDSLPSMSTTQLKGATEQLKQSKQGGQKRPLSEF